MMWDCLITFKMVMYMFNKCCCRANIVLTSTWRFGPKMCSTSLLSRIHWANWSPTVSTSTTDSVLHISLNKDILVLTFVKKLILVRAKEIKLDDPTWLMPVSRMVSVVEEKYLNASSRPSLSRLNGDSKLSLTLDQRKSAMARVGW